MLFILANTAILKLLLSVRGRDANRLVPQPSTFVIRTNPFPGAAVLASSYVNLRIQSPAKVSLLGPLPNSRSNSSHSRLRSSSNSRSSSPDSLAALLDGDSRTIYSRRLSPRYIRFLTEHRGRLGDLTSSIPNPQQIVKVKGEGKSRSGICSELLDGRQ